MVLISSVMENSHFAEVSLLPKKVKTNNNIASCVNYHATYVMFTVCT